MPKINPKDYGNNNNNGGDREEIREVGAGRKLLLGIGHYHREINGTPVVDIRFVCLEDLSGGDDLGAIATETFWLGERGLWKIAALAMATGHEEAFDPENSEDIDSVLLAGPLEATISFSMKGDRKYLRMGYLDRPKKTDRNKSGDLLLTDEQDSAVRRAEQVWAGYLKWRAKNPTGSSQSSRASSSTYHDDDIPF